MTILSLSDAGAATSEGLRPVNLRTDLAPLADLMELVFADSMDQGGAAAIREMRTLSRIGGGLGLFPGMNDLLQGISQGYVWIAGGELVGNVSIYSANWPRELGSAWIIANVGVHPDYRGRGIAASLMRASMDTIRKRGGTVAVLQVDEDNYTARRVYQRLGFIDERAWTLWRRAGAVRSGPHNGPPVFISHRRRGDWRAEYALAQRLRPRERGGIGWQRPLHMGLFRRSLWQTLTDWASMRSLERLVIRAQNDDELAAVMWIERAAMTSSIQLTLMVDPDYQGLYDDALIHLATRRFGAGRGALLIEHPSDETVTAEVLRRHYFRPQREVVHMRWDVHANG